MNNRLLEYETPSEDELVSRLLSALHRTLDEQFPNSGKPDASRRFTRTEFSSVSEDTIIEQTPGPAVGEPHSSESVLVPPPPRPADSGRNIPPPVRHSAPAPALTPSHKSSLKSETPSSLALPSALTSISRPLSRTKVATNAETDFQTGGISSTSKGFSLKLFAFMFAILLGVAIGSVVFLFWSR